MRWLVERRLRRSSQRLLRLRAELREIDEQAVHLRDDADDSAVRAMVSERPDAPREAIEARRHADAMARHRSRVVAEIRSLEQRQDALLDRLARHR
ncbi:MAG: hypothetical protein RLZZ01_2391 [Actinomycetota bacterium]